MGHNQLDKLGQLQKNLCLAISSRGKPYRGPQSRDGVNLAASVQGKQKVLLL